VRLRIPLLALLLALAAGAPAHAVSPGAVIGPRTTGENVDQVDRIARAGAEWVRIYVDWSSLEPSPGELSAFYLREYDGRVGRARAAGLKVLMVVTNSPSWASGERSAEAAPDRPEDYASIVRRMAARYAGRVSAWEMWNEPDLVAFKDDPGRYAAVLRAGHAAVKQADPAATVVLGGLVGNHYSYLERIYQAGGGGAFDAVGVHTDTACLVAGPDEQYREKDGRIGRYSFTGYREVRRTMLANGDDKPIWATEIGWSTLTSTCRVGTVAGTRPSGVDEATQAKHLTRAYRCLQAEPYVAVAFWFSLQDVSRSSTESHRFGLLRDDGRPKPAYDAFRTFARDATKPASTCGTQVDDAAPTVRILSPKAGQPYLDSIVVSARASDGRGLGVRRMELYADGVRVPGSQLGGRFRLEWNGARKLSVGRHTLTVRANDPAGNVGEASVEVVRTEAGALTVPPARLDFSAKRLGGRRVLLSGRVRAPGSPVDPKGKVRMFVEVKRGARWKPFSRYSKGVARPFRLRFAVRKPGTWRVRVRYEALAPFRTTPFRTKRLGRFR